MSKVDVPEQFIRSSTEISYDAVIVGEESSEESTDDISPEGLGGQLARQYFELWYSSNSMRKAGFLVILLLCSLTILIMLTPLVQCC